MTLPDARLIQSLCEAVDASFEASQVPLLERLVNAPSHTYAPDDVEAAAQLLDEAAVQAGMKVEKVAAGDDRFADHRIYCTPATQEETPSIALVGHVDTVFPRSMDFLTFSREGKIARGPGVLDMKSGLSIILYAWRALQAVAPSLAEGLPARFLCVSDEEIGTPTGRVLYDQLAERLTEALVFEMGRKEDRIITSRKGGGSFVIKTKGKAAHSGNFHKEGVSAVHAMALLVPRIEALTDYDRGVTLNVGIFEGGTSKNTVPEEARCVLDLRAVTQADAAWAAEQLQAMVEDPFAGLSHVPDRLRDVRFELSGAIGRPPMESTPENQALRQRYERWAAQVGFGVGEAPRQGGFSDSNLLAAHGIPTIDGLGATGAGAHSVNEWCDLDSVRRRTQAAALYLAEVALRGA